MERKSSGNGRYPTTERYRPQSRTEYQQQTGYRTQSGSESGRRNQPEEYAGYYTASGRGTTSVRRSGQADYDVAGNWDGTAGRGTPAGRRTITGAGQRAETAAGSRRAAGYTSDSRNTAGRRNTSGSRQKAGNTARGSRELRKRKAARGRKRIWKVFLPIVLVLAVVCVVAWFLLAHKGGSESAEGGFLRNLSSGSLFSEKSSGTPEVSISLDTLDSPYAIMIDVETGDVLASKSGDEVIFPASMTKIMTVLVAIEQISDLDKTITMSYDYYDALYEQDASRAGFEPGEEAKIRDLLYGALLPSGAECCMELALQAAGSESAFIDLMNQKVQELGLTQTNFTNCTGLHNDNQYSTAHEIAKILQAALKNQTFREVFTTHSYTVEPTSVHPEGFTFWSSMFKSMQAENVIGGEIKGGKTGYTSEAGFCLASMAEIYDREYIQVTAGWSANPRVSQYHINDAFLGYNILGRAISEAKEE